jgi:hypothetical protein
MRNTPPGYAAMEGLLAEQFQVITRAQTLGCGLSEGMLRHRIRDGGPWQAVLPGVYVAQTGTVTPLQRETAAVLYAGPGSLITGLAALRAHEIRAPITDRIDVLVPAGRRRHGGEFVRLIRTRRLPKAALCTGPISYAPAARAVADTARSLANSREVKAITADAIQRKRCGYEQLLAELNAGPSRGSARLRKVLAEVAEGIRSVAEGDLKRLIERERLPRPLYNPRLYAGDEFIASPDCWWPREGVAVEVDSREWHLSPEDWEKTMLRRARMTSHGIVVLNFTPGQIRGKPGMVAGTIRSTLAAMAGRPDLGIITRQAR